jgi:hypothetical protein
MQNEISQRSAFWNGYADGPVDVFATYGPVVKPNRTITSGVSGLAVEQIVWPLCHMKDFADYKRDWRYYWWRARSQSRSTIRRFLPVPVRRRLIPAPGDSRTHWVVCFYGVDRSLRHTAYGIHRHLLQPLGRAGVSVTVIAHFNRIGAITGKYSKEGGVDFSKDQVRLLNPDLLWVEPQTDAAIATEMLALEGVPWKIETALFSGAKKNLMHQLHSLGRVRDLVTLAGVANADVFCALRADLQYLDDLNVEQVQNDITSGRADLITPDWQRWGGLNDRFCFFGKSALDHVLGRRALVERFAQENGYIHAEELLLHAAKTGNLRLGHTKMRAERVRGNGRVQFEPFGDE